MCREGWRTSRKKRCAIAIRTNIRSRDERPTNKEEREKKLGTVREIVRVTAKRNETKRDETKRNETRRNETKRNETKRNETKRNETKRNESLFLAASVCMYMRQSINRACVAQTQKSSTPVRECTGSLSVRRVVHSRRVALGAPLLHMHTTVVRRSRVQGVWIKDIKDSRCERSPLRVPAPFGSSPLHARTTKGLLSSVSSTSHTLTCFSYRARYHFYCRRECLFQRQASLVPPPRSSFTSPS